VSNNGVRILIDRREGNRFYWRLNAYGEEYFPQRSEATAAKAAEQAEALLTQVELSRHCKNQRTA
jgi:hypothetical protein